MAYYKSILAYDGTDFHGFQRQVSGRRTVQGVFEAALKGLGWPGGVLRAAGRTDTGVHARGQVVAYDLEWRRAPAQLAHALNAHLPFDVAVTRTEPAEEDFHPRFSARARRYSYTVLLAEAPDPLRERFAWRIWPEPDLAGTQSATDVLMGRHDFRAFGSAPIQGGHTVRCISLAEWRRNGQSLVLLIEADAFLYRMVRRLAAGVLDVGGGRRRVSELVEALEHPERHWIGRVAPARGLCLEAVVYDE